MRHTLKKLSQARFAPKTAAIIQLSALVLFLALFFWWGYPKTRTIAVQTPQIATTTKEATFPEIEIEAKSAYVYDVKTGKAVYSKDSELQLPLASLTKLMTSYAASQIVPDYLVIRIEPEDVREEGDTGLHTGESWKFDKLVDYTLITSSNDGARAIARTAGTELATSTDTSPLTLFVWKMNDVARSLGLHETYFVNQSGLDVSKTLSGAYGSAKDISMLVTKILKENPHLLEATQYSKSTISSNLLSHYAENTNKALLDIPNVIGSKTGYTDLSGGNVVVAWNAGIDRPIVVAVLGSSYEGRFKDLSKLTEATIEYLKTASESR